MNDSKEEGSRLQVAGNTKDVKNTTVSPATCHLSPTDHATCHLSPNVLIEASAGTGKTQALAERLIALLKEGIEPQEIVALTFSRAAAGEIFERFVTLLAKQAEEVVAGTGSEEGSRLQVEGGRLQVAGNTKDVKNSTVSPATCHLSPTDPATCHLSPTDPVTCHLSPISLLRKVIATQHLSQIGTLDSFLMKIVRAFPLELGLNGELEMLDDFEAKSERAKISFSILRRTDAKIKKNFVAAFALAMNHEDVRSFVESYRNFIGDWHEKVAALPAESAWGDPTPIWGGPKAFTGITEKELAASADAIAGFEPAKQWTEFAEWVRNFRGSFSGVKGIAKKLLELDGVFEGATVEFAFNRKQYAYGGDEAAAIRTALMCVFGYVVRMKLELAKGVYTLISAFEKEYDAKVRRKGRLVFADIPRLIAELDESDRLALEYRMDARIRAWALDEFQDTSREQWKALWNLIDEAKQSDEKSLFVVGDTKQAIYGWRNGDVSIFEKEHDSGAYELGELVKTYRSGPAIVEAVNKVFAGGRLCADYPAWKCPEHVSAKPEMTSFVQTVEAGGPYMDDFVEPVYNALKAADPVRCGKTAAVLVRNNTFGQLLCDELKRRGIKDVVWEGEKKVLGTVALAGFIDLVQLAEHPGDMLTYRHFLKTPLAELVEAKDAGELSRKMAEAFTARGLVRVFRELRAKLPSDPERAWSRYTEERYTDMLKVAAEFEIGMKAGTRLSDFRGYLESRTKRELAEEGKIRIMTIHRSKGLGFDYVVLPLYEHDALTKEQRGPLVGDNWILPDPGAKVAKAVGGLEQAYTLRKDRAEQEALCTYYVAMTRAKEAMTIILHPQPKGAATGVRMSDYVREGIGSEAELGDRGWFCGGEEGARLQVAGNTKDVKNSTVSPVTCHLSPTVKRGPRVAVRKRLPSKGFVSGQSAGELFAPKGNRRAAMDRGTEIHAQYERLEWFEGAEKPEGFVELWRERPFEVFADGEWISGRFDRVVFYRKGSRLQVAGNTKDVKNSTVSPATCHLSPLYAEVQDIKTGRPKPDSYYEPQLAAYRRAVHLLTGIPPERIASRILHVG